MFEFHWRVSESGFEWVRHKYFEAKGEGGEVEYLAEVGDVWPSQPRVPISYRTYEPLKRSALFKMLAGVDPTPAGILAFANEYGTLGDSAERVIVDGGSGYPPRTTSSQSLSVWRREIVRMRHAVALWEAIKQGDSGFLSQHIQWDAPHNTARMNGFTYTVSTIFTMTFTLPSGMPEIDAMLNLGDPIWPARLALREYVNYRLKELTLAPEIGWNYVHGKLHERIHFVPGDLVSALWLQLAKAIEGDLEYSQCDECGDWYEISGDRRADARFCSDPCRFKAYRKRQKEALRLHAAGVPPKDIAKQLGSDAKTVKGWIAKGTRDVKTKTR